MARRKKRKRDKKNLTPMQLLEQASRRSDRRRLPPDDSSLLNAIVGSVWAARPVGEQPVLHIARWRISEVTVDGRRERHVWGWNLQDREGRASTAITEVRSPEHMLVTGSGRRYRLIGPPGVDPDGAWVWNVWCARFGATDEIDVTAEIHSTLPAEQ